MTDSIQDQVIQDLEARKKIGLENYGTLLYSEVEGDMLLHLYEELLDAACYVKTLIERRKDLDSAIDSYNRYPSLANSDEVTIQAEKFIRGFKNES